MTQSIVNFLIDGDLNTAGLQLVTAPRIFDFEISPDAQILYQNLITTIQNNLVPNATPTQIQAVSDALNTLNSWSQLRLVDASGPGGALVQTYQINGYSVKVDANGKPLSNNIGSNPPIPPGQLPPLDTLSDTNLATPSFTYGSTTVTSTMDRYMAENVDKLIRAFRSAGWDPIYAPGTNDNGAVAKLTGSDAALYGIVNVGATLGLLSQSLAVANQARVLGMAAATQSQSIQQVLMVDYVSRGNELLFNEMSKLREAIDLNQTVLSYLNSLQDLMNQKDPERFVLQLQYLNNIIIGTDASRDAFDTYEKQTYDNAITALAKFQNDGSLKAYLAGPNSPPDDPLIPQANAAFDDLNPILTSVVQYSKKTIMDNLDYFTGQLTALTGTTPGSEQGLLLALNKIRADFNALPDSNDPIKQWVQDAQAGDEGDYQRHLNDAITGSQSFNDSQREELRRVMFTFEEFYKSATALLSRLTQLLEKIATSISR